MIMGSGRLPSSCARTEATRTNTLSVGLADPELVRTLGLAGAVADVGRDIVDVQEEPVRGRAGCVCEDLGVAGRCPLAELRSGCPLGEQELS
jgi:hypothetical protein